MHEELVNLAQENVWLGELTDRPNMTIAVDWEITNQNKKMLKAPFFENAIHCKFCDVLRISLILLGVHWG